ncbi:GRAM domain-containing protein 4 [Saguinus oedipus]|uniref:GRAM domain-containing protein 4 n=1 Tax=Saguinus oedipus TaxID=9490 RepID=A0ABQ9WJJ7_SAGOE|nr:GRAM domain-containing protein 4 [Saguinus oedipus]
MNAVWHGWAIPLFLFLAILRLSLNYLIARGWRIQWSIVPEVSEPVEPPKEDLTVSEKFQLVLDVAQKAQVLPRAPARGMSTLATGTSQGHVYTGHRHWLGVCLRWLQLVPRES